MPNHVTNRLCITGPKKDRDAFQATFTKKEERGNADVGQFSLGQVVPMPADIFRGNLGRAEEIAYPGDKNWYGWSCTNWGTKWDCYDVCDPEIGAKSIKLEFQTAWSPPDAWMTTASKKFPTLKFCNKWKDEGGPSGTHTFRNGEPA
jgi:hypothetical protein